MNKAAFFVASQLALAIASVSHAQSPDGLWLDMAGKAQAQTESAFHYRGIAADIERLKVYLQDAPLEGALEGLPFYYPKPDGGFLLLEAFYSPVMAPELEAKYPELRTYKVFGVEDKGVSGRIDTTPRGFHGYVNTPEATMVIEPESSFSETESASQYRGFFKEDMPSKEPLQCDTAEHDHSIESGNEYGYLKSLEMPGLAERVSFGDSYKVYRLAMAATGEFSASVSSDSSNPSVAETQAFIVSVVNRLNQIYEKEVAVRFQLVADNDSIIYTDSSTDPYSSSSNMLPENQSNLDSVIGTADYDVGHLLNQVGGGLAYVGVVCSSTHKAQGRTGLGNPDGRFEYFVSDLLAHELGHQFGAGHTFNATSGDCGGGRRSASSAWEVGSGSTIMSYSGLCSPQNIQNNADDYFNGGSLEQIHNHLTVSGASCGTQVNTGNAIPTVNAGPDYTIPAQTPFMLTATANDTDPGDLSGLTYTWEQQDKSDSGGTSDAVEMATDDGQRPLFRSFQGTTSPTRYFPKLDVILSGDLSGSLGETLPTTDRDLNFRVTVRSGDFGVNQDDVKLTVDGDSGPFKVTAPGAGSYTGGQQMDVAWNVANTNLAPVSCSQVDIELSKDGGSTFTTIIKAGASNDGFERVVAPNTDTTNGRIRVKCSDNVFFSISPANFSLVSVNTSGNISVSAVSANQVEGNSGQTAFTFQVSRQYAIVDMTVDYNVAGAGANPANATDFGGVLPSGAVSLAAGEFSKTFTVNVSGDTTFETDETFTLTISNPSSGIVSQATASGVISNDDEEPAGGDSGGSDSGGSDSGGSDSGGSDSGGSDSGGSDSGSGDSGSGDSGSGDSGGGDSGGGDSGGGGAVWLMLAALGWLRLKFPRK
ncbi:M12 family metallo-peptidase [Hahella aquimaris]|uniref:reprolysin-like metallopeptidase n=1 Tax=Hahella sp. HNIBRBA332 TaxID=3015983 RepID=UPI00273B786C|nr:zinc-dependent metalloprotease family protein [Hahella sp. HNIBRBA332]WLQ17174.1 M12 family metallo-peptidase [Hahella sp. HNIBRBA332]